MKLPITDMSGLKIFESAEALPYTGSGPVGPPAPAAPAGTSTPAPAGGCAGAGATPPGCAAPGCAAPGCAAPGCAAAASSAVTFCCSASSCWRSCSIWARRSACGSCARAVDAPSANTATSTAVQVTLNGCDTTDLLAANGDFEENENELGNGGCVQGGRSAAGGRSDRGRRDHRGVAFDRDPRVGEISGAERRLSPAGNGR